MGKHRVPSNWPELYVAHYLVNGNKQDACLAAGFAKTTARGKCAEKHNDPRVQELLAKASEVAEEKFDVSIRKTLEHMHDRAFYDIGEIAGVKITKPADIAKLPENIRRAIDGWDFDAKGKIRLKLANRGTEQEKVAKHLGMFVDRVEVNVSVSEQSTSALQDELKKITERLNQMDDGDAGGEAAD